MIQFRAEVAPGWNAVAGIPPRRQRQADHVQHAKDGANAHKNPEQQRQADEQLHGSHRISEKNRMWQDDVSQNWTIYPHGAAIYVPAQVVLKPAVGESGVEYFVFPKEQEEHGSGHARERNCPGGNGEGGRHALSTGAIVADVLFQRVQFLGQVIDARLQDMADRQDSQKPAFIIDDR